jgi:TPR repeat protein
MPRSQFIVAGAYMDGRGVDRDMEQALRWFRTSAENGHAKAAFILGFLYLEGLRIERDDAQALRWIRMAAEAGHPDALKTLEEFERSQGEPSLREALETATGQEFLDPGSCDFAIRTIAFMMTQAAQCAGDADVEENRDIYECLTWAREALRWIDEADRRCMGDAERRRLADTKAMILDDLPRFDAALKYNRGEIGAGEALQLLLDAVGSGQNWPTSE